MPNNEVKQRKKTQKPNEQSSNTPNNCEDEAKKVETTKGVHLDLRKTSVFSLDLRTIACLLSVVVCTVLTWVVLKQNEKLTDVEEKYKHLYGKTANLLEMEEEVLKVTKKCDSIQGMLEGQRGGLPPHLEQDVSQLKEWAAGLTETRSQLQASLAALSSAVGQIEERTSAIAKDVTNKVASVRTDVRRMDGLQSEVESLLAQVGELEDKTAAIERSMVKRIGDVLGASIDRMAGLRAASERDAQALEQLRRRIPELTAADKQLSDRLRELESGRARLIRTVTFAGDLKPKVATIKRDFAAFEPQLADLTLRIGRLAEDLVKREVDIAELRQTFDHLNVVEGDLGVVTKQFSQISDIPHVGEILQQANVSEALPQTHSLGE
ncbi:inhibitor of nuclear factor kappa-B kinase-interacting protein isoform X2 [Hypomesus transpacificus]|uniref:inhibitor of nuclear factor kappa-B kinase-interacting protein isoform X2 n=1 Tax=Hypomesus transpacificus TaxID=137520 RepID=UPI001F07E849|nr:inhibitor of nuclear factor kappa-B kinase-interacting protein isoform X2 [Hypomesus transpacificus]